MFHPTHPQRARRAGLALAMGATLIAAAPGVAQAAAVNLGTTTPFVVLGGSTVTNTGPSVLNGELGVSPGAALTGFGLPAVVNGAVHQSDAVALQAQADLITAYDTAAGQPVSGANDFTSAPELGNRTLQAGAYRFSSSAQLTGPLTLDAAGDPNAQFVFEIGSTLTTAGASSVNLINGASPCNVFWQVGSSATLGGTTAFAGNVLALTTITAGTGATVSGRLLARNGAVNLDSNVLNLPSCTTPPTDGTTTPGDTSTTPGSPGTTPGGTTSPSGAAGGTVTSPGTSPGTGAGRPASTGGAKVPPASRSTLATRKGTASLRRTPGTGGTPGSLESCRAGFSASVRGAQIKKVVFSLDGRRIASRSGSPFQVLVRATPGKHNVTARVTFKDATKAKTLKLGYRACAALVLRPQRGPSQFTG